ncbi:MAG: hypothetical protein IJJ76_13960 [Ruminococcus sp.]|uniref:hypothetical protein n=1 Tax=Ruminococcus sp. TaxID=41978 RepID=UPI0025E1CCB5|nr:hypothetical protein [Ruminococcus sp.]MBR0530855.1 hypothetical protein [Ruminococcus sp.]
MTRKFGGKQRRGGVTERAIRKEKRVLNSREQHSPCAGDELPACASRTATASSAVVAQLLSRNGELSRQGHADTAA